MKFSMFLALFAVVLACLQVQQVYAAEESRFFDDCSTTNMRVVNQRRFQGGDVYMAKSFKADPTASVLKCNALCQADIECWSWNYDKNRKMCYLQSSEDSEMSSQKLGSWAMGFRVCKPSDSDWNNTPMSK